MMISRKCDYALRAMLELALREGKGPVPIGQIARAQAIPVRFLEAILRQLKQAGLADSNRGKEGGYFLALPARNLTVGAIIEVFEGRAGPAAPEARNDVFASLWKEADDAIQAVYGRVTLGDLADREIQRHQDNAGNFSI